MTATFGGLENAVLTPGDGLTVITAPNEGGKSTWAGFWRAMLYGIDTRERDKAGYLADKNRFQPWSGAPMFGEVQLEWQGNDITIRRFPAKSNPFGGFEAVYTASGDPVPGLTAANVGEQLTGASREVYLRSAFVGQGGAAISPNGELEARISSLATAGQEDISYSAAERTLKDWRNHRRANRANGLIPELQAALADTEQSIDRTAQARGQISAAGAALVRLEEERAQLRQECEIWARLARHDLNRRYGQAQSELAQTQAELAELTPPEPELAGLTLPEARDWAAARQAQYDEALGAREAALNQQRTLAEQGRRTAGQMLAFAAAFLALSVFLAVMAALGVFSLALPLCAVSALAGAACLLLRLRRKQENLRRLQSISVPEPSAPERWAEKAQRHCDYLAARQRLADAVRHTQSRLEDLKAQGAQDFDTMELLTPPARTPAEINARLAAVEGEIARRRDELARAEGALQQAADPDELDAHLGQLQTDLARRTEEFEGISIAMKALSAANDTLRQRFSPALNRAAGLIFSALTDGKYQELSLARDFSAQTSAEGSLPPRSALALSTGTAEQLYLAVRLALCRLTLPDAPIWLDDALAAFDEKRMRQALKFLRVMGDDRQILLFSCHRRESEWAAAHGVPALTLQ